MNRRMGRFSISREALRISPDDVKRVMGKCIIIKCEPCFMRDTFDYVAICDDFRAVPDGEVAPEYTVEIEADKVGFVEVG